MVSRLARVAALVLSAALGVTLLTGGPVQASHDGTFQDGCPDDRVPSAGFSDVRSSDVHGPSVYCVVWWGVANGTSATTYDQSAPVSRAQMASFIARLLDVSGRPLAEPTDDHFSDDDADTHHANINRLAEAGIVGGLGAGRYGPGQAVSRAQMASFLMRAYQFRTDETLQPAPDRFGDDNGNVHETNIDKAAEAGFTGGMAPGVYGPSAVVSRGQMASFLARVLDSLVESELSSPPQGTDPEEPDPGSEPDPDLGSDRFRAIYAVPAGATPDSSVVPAIRHELDLVNAWFADQTDGREPRFQRLADGSIDVAVLTLNATAAEIASSGGWRVAEELTARGHRPEGVAIVAYVEATGSGCGSTMEDVAVLWMPACDIRPSTQSVAFPANATYLAAHEMVHAFGAVPPCAPNYDAGSHVGDDSRDVLYQGPDGRDWENLMLDPGRDDYYGHGRSDCLDISDSLLWVSRP